MSKKPLYKRIWDSLFRGPEGLIGATGADGVCKCECCLSYKWPDCPVCDGRGHWNGCSGCGAGKSGVEGVRGSYNEDAVTPERQVAQEVAGAVSAVFMRKFPDLVMPTDEVLEAVDAVVGGEVEARTQDGNLFIPGNRSGLKTKAMDEARTQPGCCPPGKCADPACQPDTDNRKMPDSVQPETGEPDSMPSEEQAKAEYVAAIKIATDREQSRIVALIEKAGNRRASIDFHEGIRAAIAAIQEGDTDE